MLGEPATVGVGVGAGVEKMFEIFGVSPISVIFTWVVTFVLLTPSDTKYALIAFARALASLLTLLSLTPGNFPAVPVTIKVASEPLLANAFLIAAFWSSLKTEEPAANVREPSA